MKMPQTLTARCEVSWLDVPLAHFDVTAMHLAAEAVNDRTLDVRVRITHRFRVLLLALRALAPLRYLGAKFRIETDWRAS